MPFPIARSVPLFLLLAACGPTNGGTQNPNLSAGGQSYSPPTSGGAGGSGGGAGTTSTAPATTNVACSGSAGCASWYCRCADGAVVNASYCSYGACAAASGICPEACATFQHGAWTGEYNGGPVQSGGTGGGSGAGSCAAAADCPSFPCACGDGSLVNSRSCTNGRCDSESTTCTSACSDSGGWP